MFCANKIRLEHLAFPDAVEWKAMRPKIVQAGERNTTALATSDCYKTNGTQIPPPPPSQAFPVSTLFVIRLQVGANVQTQCSVPTSLVRATFA
ncbi:MAG: hypothetical protein JWO71_1871 [Candidatus Acidoferrum typicum]|nr:hypothetical protein [Candidatus Acidoferrum typicum]